MRDRRVWIGTMGIGAVVAAFVWALAARPDVEPESAAPEAATETAAVASRPEGPAPPAEIPRDVAQDLAARLARAADSGMPGPLAVGSADPARPAAAAEPPRPAVRLDRPPTVEEQLEYAGRLHDWIVIRRDDLRHRLEELEQSGQGSSQQAERVRWELRRLDETEPTAARFAAELAERARRERAARASSGAPPSDEAL